VQGERERALATLEEAVAAAPQSADARHALAAAYHESGQLAAAATGYREALRLDPTHAPSQGDLALLRAHQK
jgi:Tfp pilus assembly protein PilF